VKVSLLVVLEKGLVVELLSSKSDFIFANCFDDSELSLSLLHDVNNATSTINVILNFILVLLFVQYKGALIAF
ncbi:hypothetical protein J9332_42140, partial [Aquimarina celericrescens]|nr:hypothetical protein [Aquimarina celericrescens]